MGTTIPTDKKTHKARVRARLEIGRDAGAFNAKLSCASGGPSEPFCDEPATVGTGVNMVLPATEIGPNTFCGGHPHGTGEMTGIHWIEEAGVLGRRLALRTHQWAWCVTRGRSPSKPGGPPLSPPVW